MRVLLVVAHPNPDSFNHALRRRLQRGLAAAGHEVRLRDLHAPAFDPVLDGAELAGLQAGTVAPAVRAEQDLLRWAEGLVFVYPLWWFDRPAVLKGWCDRVLTHGFAFRYGPEGVTGLLPQRKALVVVTAGGSADEFRALEVDPDELARPMVQGTLRFCGVPQVESRVFLAVGTVEAAARAAMLAEAEALGRAF